ncbi:MAG: hypothetical protein J07HB67_01720 [halophilic archaeon J07HB67]|nr:MAG: hypothetical protein J07HB67_01720 [halophilic archaeon J07HB67]
MTAFHRPGVDTVVTALDIGYSHLDTAQWYDNETEVAAGSTVVTGPSTSIGHPGTLPTDPAVVGWISPSGPSSGFCPGEAEAGA